MRTKLFVLLLVLLFTAAVMGLSFVLVSWNLRTRPAPDDIVEGVREVAGRSPELQALYQSALEDGVLTMVEASKILSAAEDD